MDFPAWDPVLFDFPGPLDIRWYGLMYVFGFLVGQQILVRLARAGFLPVDPKIAPDLVFYCVIGVMLGGRTGYALFYDTTHQLILPWNFVQVWRGGLSFHGGLGGVAVARVGTTRAARWPILRRMGHSQKRSFNRPSSSFQSARSLTATPRRRFGTSTWSTFRTAQATSMLATT